MKEAITNRSPSKKIKSLLKGGIEPFKPREGTPNQKRESIGSPGLTDKGKDSILDKMVLDY